jgi:hypothetical protein
VTRSKDWCNGFCRTCGAGCAEYCEDIHQARLEIEKLRETLELIARPKRPDGTYNRSREACEQLAREALGEK